MVKKQYKNQPRNKKTGRFVTVGKGRPYTIRVSDSELKHIKQNRKETEST